MSKMSIIDIRGILVSSEVITTYFLCDLERCKGACCVEGDGGAPVSEEELPEMERAFPLIKGLLREEAAREAAAKGLTYIDGEGDRLTQLFRGGECAFTCFTSDGSARCAFEKGCSEGISPDFYKPVSCHLYPVRLSKVGDTTAVNYHRWKPICEPARRLGRERGVRLYRFLREPLTRAFGEEWYEELEETAELYLKLYEA